MSTNFAKEFKLYESLFSERKHKLTEAAQNNNCFFMVLYRNPESYYIWELTKDEATARKAYNKLFNSFKTDDLFGYDGADEALILVKVFDFATYEKVKSFVGNGLIKDKNSNNLLDSVLDDSDTLEYYEPDEDEYEQAGNNQSTNDYRVVLADYDTDDFDINVEFGLQDPDENEVVDYEYLLEPGQTRGDLVVYLSRDCGFTSIYVHDERPANANDIKRLAQDTFPVTGTGDDWEDYGHID